MENATIFENQFTPRGKPQVSTLLIPRRLWDRVQSEIERSGMSTGQFLANLVSTLRDPGSEVVGTANQLTTSYQPAGHDLQRLSFRVDPFVWHEFKCLARAHGFSMCHLFMLLMFRLWQGLIRRAVATAKLHFLHFRESVDRLRPWVLRKLERKGVPKPTGDE